MGEGIPLEILRENIQYLYSAYPPDKEVMEFHGPKPISFRRSKKDLQLITEFIECQTAEIPWICTEDISIRIEWMINDRDRYESDSVPDLDNIVKPILDSLCGQKGIIIDDCQVVDFSASCLGGWDPGRNCFHLHFNLPTAGLFDNYGCIPRTELIFVDIGDNLFVPVNRKIESEVWRVESCLEWVRNRPRNNPCEEGMPIRRIFHRTRVAKRSEIKMTAEEFIGNYK